MLSLAKNKNPMPARVSSFQDTLEILIKVFFELRGFVELLETVEKVARSYINISHKKSRITAASIL